MATLTHEMKEMIAEQHCFIGTVNEDGVPNVAPKGSTRILTDDSLVFTENTGGATYANIRKGSKVAVAVVNCDKLDGYRFIGNTSIYENGELYEHEAKMSLNKGMPKPHAVVVIHIKEIYSLMPGAMAGKQIA
jgi:uncharacterized protein